MTQHKNKSVYALIKLNKIPKIIVLRFIIFKKICFLKKIYGCRIILRPFFIIYLPYKMYT